MPDTVTVPREDWKVLVHAVTNIEVALAGSHVLGTKGLIWEVSKLKEQMVELQNREERRKGIFWAFGILWAALVTAVGFLFGKKM